MSYRAPDRVLKTPPLAAAEARLEIARVLQYSVSWWFRGLPHMKGCE
jgi:hypothetical protein